MLFGVFSSAITKGFVGSILAYGTFSIIFMVWSGYIFSTVLFGVILKSGNIFIHSITMSVAFTLHCATFFVLAGGYGPYSILRIVVLGAVAVARDVTERVERERAAKRSS